jgi:hypothetical protein
MFSTIAQSAEHPRFSKKNPSSLEPSIHYATDGDAYIKLDNGIAILMHVHLASLLILSSSKIGHEGGS